MSEDRFFILRFLCYANKVVTIDQQLYHYIIRDSGCMSQGLINPKALLSNKIDGVRERGIVRDIFIKKRILIYFVIIQGV